ncbi:MULTISPECIES: YciI family protein [unclassified Rhodococcus (in: high G+C Gram-positive bacteria)]|uniref:YciI family protein n=1 Tax=unclassified Rhodococcus (in: high G+C Gram-positive bacteria) TaxID=192944 RepID=UPI00163A9F05|nr:MULTISPECIES: YciI family protein [unclassified Rhodococcus (in: high G+C Gram-positive bacteria)]MBC2641660.1 transcription initiation protein [Rhodococcus sp. 3A]MBC2893595.1 transcription initiation protein [Rhodococcus sp. 4CII]
MYYLALLAGETNATEWGPDSPEFAVALGRHRAFWERAGSALAGGGALYPSTEAATVRNEDGRALITDGPFAETAEVIGGFYVLQGSDLDEVLEIARHIPEAAEGSVELWPMVEWMPVTDQKGCWLALLREPVAAAVSPGTPQWDEGMAEHEKFGRLAGSAIRGGGALHTPDSATTIRVRDGELLLTDGPFAETAEVANGLYVLAADDREAAIAWAAKIPVSPKGCIELRQIVADGE